MLRVSLLVVGVILLIPVAMIFRSGDGGRSVETAGLPGASAILEAGAALSTDGETGLSNDAAATTAPNVSSAGAIDDERPRPPHSLRRRHRGRRRIDSAGDRSRHGGADRGADDRRDHCRCCAAHDRRRTEL